MSKLIQCSRGGSPGKRMSNLPEESVATVSTKCRRTSSRRCNCKAQIIMKPAGPRGFVVMSFVEEHNHSQSSKPTTIFLKCNRALSLGY